jgi:hypothetical protein
MARLAFAIVGRGISYDVLMWIVTCSACNARICPTEAAAVGQTVGLKSHVHHTQSVISNHRFPGAMALTTEVGDILGGHFL